MAGLRCDGQTECKIYLDLPGFTWIYLDFTWIGRISMIGRIGRITRLAGSAGPTRVRSERTNTKVVVITIGCHISDAIYACF